MKSNLEIFDASCLTQDSPVGEDLIRSKSSHGVASQNPVVEHAYVYIYIYNIYIYKQMCIYIYKQMYTHIHIHLMYIHTYLHIHIDTYPQQLCVSPEKIYNCFTPKDFNREVRPSAA